MDSGSTNHKTSVIVDHANSDQHKAAMNHLRSSLSVPITEYSPIARGLLTMDETSHDRVGKKFDICYMMAKECLPFTKYSALHELEAKHGVDLGYAYRTKDSARLFSHYIARSQQEEFHTSSRFFSFLMDGSTDKGNIEDELIVLLYFIKDENSQEIKTIVRYHTILEPRKADADGLIECLSNALRLLGIDTVLDKASVLRGRPILIGGGTGGGTVCEHWRAKWNEVKTTRIHWLVTLVLVFCTQTGTSL